MNKVGMTRRRAAAAAAGLAAATVGAVIGMTLTADHPTRVSTPSAVTSSPPSPSVTQAPAWRRVFTDQFTGTTLDPVWKPRGTSYTPGMTRAKSDARACLVDGTGYLHVRTIPDPAKPGYYLDCHIGTMGSPAFTYGQFSIRAKMHPWPGSHAAFWLQSNPGYVPYAAEVDIVERMGADNPYAATGTDVLSNVYWDWTPAADGMQSKRITVNDAKTLPTGQRWWNSFHTFSVDWWPGGYYFRVDGRLTGTVRDGVSRVPEFLVLSMLTRDYEVAKHAGHPASSYQMIVDWVTVDQWMA